MSPSSLSLVHFLHEVLLVSAQPLLTDNKTGNCNVLCGHRNFFTSKTWLSCLCVLTKSSVLLDPGEHCLLPALHVGFHVESEAMWEDKWRYNVSIISDHSKHHDVDRVFSFYEYEFGLVYSEIFVLELPT